MTNIHFNPFIYASNDIINNAFLVSTADVRSIIEIVDTYMPDYIEKLDKKIASYIFAYLAAKNLNEFGYTPNLSPLLPGDLYGVAMNEIENIIKNALFKAEISSIPLIYTTSSLSGDVEIDKLNILVSKFGPKQLEVAFENVFRQGLEHSDDQLVDTCLKVYNTIQNSITGIAIYQLYVLSLEIGHIIYKYEYIYGVNTSIDFLSMIFMCQYIMIFGLKPSLIKNNITQPRLSIVFNNFMITSKKFIKRPELKKYDTFNDNFKQLYVNISKTIALMRDDKLTGIYNYAVYTGRDNKTYYTNSKYDDQALDTDVMAINQVLVGESYKAIGRMLFIMIKHNAPPETLEFAYFIYLRTLDNIPMSPIGGNIDIIKNTPVEEISDPFSYALVSGVIAMELYSRNYSTGFLVSKILMDTVNKNSDNTRKISIFKRLSKIILRSTDYQLFQTTFPTRQYIEKPKPKSRIYSVVPYQPAFSQIGNDTPSITTI